ncbi:MAG: hypothetical protein JO296_16355 [Pseudonocardiales bacterium]|nr:hypothetical protein [Pseudonocardiales bacterium]
MRKTDHKQTVTRRGNGRSSREWVPPPAPRVIAHVDLSRMEPASAGANRGGLAPLADYIGGRLTGQITLPGFHGLLRDEFGQNLDGCPVPPSPYYQLYRDGVALHYVHSSLIGEPREPAEGD